MTLSHPQSRLSRSTPEALGIDSSALLSFVEAVERAFGGFHSFMLVRHGQVAAEGAWKPYEADRPHMLFSLSKSFTSTAVGLAVAEGRLSVEDSVVSFFPEETPAEVSENLAAMRVRHLLSMSTGHAADALGPLLRRKDGDWARSFLDQPMEHEPGTHFVYNSGATYMLSAIVQRVAGQTLLDYLGPRLFKPLDIEGATWEACPHGVNTGGWGLSVRIEDIARFGQLYLQKGIWEGRRLLPESWVEEASAAQISNGFREDSDWEQGYGYQFWRCRHGAYRGDGAFGQFCVVMSEQDAVLAITSGVGDMQGALNLVWEHLLPAMGDSPLPESRAAQNLDRKLATLFLRPPQGISSSPVEARVSGLTYAFEANGQGVASLALDFEGSGTVLTIRDGRGEHRILCGAGEWRKGITTFDHDGPRPAETSGARAVAASGAWATEDTYVVGLCFTETPFCPTLTFRFEGDQLTYEYKGNVGFGPTERPPLVGRSAR